MTQTLTTIEIEQINSRLLFRLPPIHSAMGLVFGQGVYSYLLVPQIVEALKNGHFPKFIISGGAKVLGTPDAQALIPYIKHAYQAQDNDLPIADETEATYIHRLLPDFAKAHAILEPAGLNTGENVTLSRPLGLDAAGSLTFICAASMAARAMGTLRKHFPSPTQKPISFLPVYPHGINADNWPAHPFASNSMTSEFRKLTAYLDQGFIVPTNVEEERAALESSGLKMAP
jgi:hypothetical protein